MTETFVWDTTGPLHAAAADRTDVLLEAAGPHRTHVLPAGVAEELLSKGFDLSGAYKVTDIDSLDLLVSLAWWEERLGSSASGFDTGEAWVAALAQAAQGVAIVDDRRATRVIRANSSIPVHGVIWAICRGIAEGRVDGPGAYEGLCNLMIQDHGELGRLRWPFGPFGFSTWVTEHPEVLAA